ncbi:histone-lysine N-methyltransferase SETMAR [Trichonephila clavipes]|nr:histone-lysine N-methyltransferase SETMAR [Trichonephila clavipes]
MASAECVGGPRAPTPQRCGAGYLVYRQRVLEGCGIFDVKDAPRTSRPVVDNVDKIAEIIEINRHVSSRSIAQELKIDRKAALSHLRKVGFKKKLHVGVPDQLTPKKHDGSNFHLRSLAQTE